MKWLIYGANGWIGEQLSSFINNNRKNDEVIKASSRADDKDGVMEELTSLKPDIVFSCVGRTHGIGFSTIDYLEQKGKIKDNVRDNLFSPLNLARCCEQHDVYFVYLGTGCIFEYDKDRTESVGFEESDEPNFFGSAYSVVKGFTDKLMQNSSFTKNTLNLRIRMPITGVPNIRNFITKITSYDKVVNIPNSMTVIPTILPHLMQLVDKRITGTVNLTNPGVISHNEILDMYKEIVDDNFTYENFSIEEQNKVLHSKRSNNYLATDKLQQLCPGIPHVKSAVRESLIEYKKHSINQTLLITGGCGFIGSNMLIYLYENYPKMRIINVDSITYCSSENNVPENIRLDSYRYKYYKASICDRKMMNEVFAKNKIDTVLHFAAETHVDKSFNSSLVFTKTNVLGTHTLLQVSMLSNHPLKKFIHISTDEVYGDTDYEQQVIESNKLNPTNPYSATKAGAEALVNSYQYSFKHPSIIIRCNNVYGPKQFPEKLIPRFILQLLSGEKMTIHGNGCSVRSFIHVSDVLKGIDKVMQEGEINGMYNIGVDDEFSVKQVSEMIYEAIHKDKKVKSYKECVTFVEDRKFNDQRYFINSSKLKSLGWNPDTKFEIGLLETVNWYKENYQL